MWFPAFAFPATKSSKTSSDYEGECALIKDVTIFLLFSGGIARRSTAVGSQLISRILATVNSNSTSLLSVLGQLIIYRGEALRHLLSPRLKPGLVTCQIDKSSSSKQEGLARLDINEGSSIQKSRSSKNICLPTLNFSQLGFICLNQAASNMILLFIRTFLTLPFPSLSNAIPQYPRW